MELPYTGYLFSKKNMFSFVSLLKEEQFSAYKDLPVIDVDREISKCSVLRKCSVLFSIDFWGAKPRPWPLYIHGSAYTQARNFFSDQIYPYQNKLFKTSWINYIFYFNWLRKAVILQAWHCLRPKLLWFR